MKNTTNKKRVDMKYRNNIITRNSFFTKRLLVGILCAIVALFLVACDVKGETSNKTNKTNITGTFSYPDIRAVVGVVKTSDLPTWVDSVPAGGVAYSLARVDGNAVASGISIDESTGVITVVDTATRSSIDQYRVTATATGEYTGTIETDVNVWVQAFVYAKVEIDANSSASIEQSPPSEVNISSLTFVLREPSEGLSIDNTGKITIIPLVPNTIHYISGGTYVIGVTERGGETYEVGIDIVFPKPADKGELITLIDSTLTAHGNKANLNFIDTSLITDMSELFKNKTTFNGGISDWNVSSVTNMQYMFAGATVFNGGISGWDVSNVGNMEWMFYQASAFNQDILNWNVDNVTTMTGMFQEAVAFNGDLSGWAVSNVTNMGRMFQGAVVFNGDISGWDVSNVTSMEWMFKGASVFNGDLSGWDVGNVTTMSYMFSEASTFNGDISEWDVSNITTLKRMFYNAVVFNQNLENWKDKLIIDVETIAMFVGSGLDGSEPNWYSTTP